MAKEMGKYDSEIQMFVQTLPPINRERLLFEHWLCANGRGEHLPYSRPSGELALAVAIQNDNLPVLEVRRRTIVEGD